MAHVSPPMSPLLRRNGGGATAFDRLEADKAKYVKTPEVIERRQNPALNASLSPAMSRKVFSTPYSNEQQINYSPCKSLSPTTEKRNFPTNCTYKQQTNQAQNTSHTPVLHRKPPSSYRCHERQKENSPCSSFSPTGSRRILLPHCSSEPQADGTVRISCNSPSSQKHLTPHHNPKQPHALSSPVAVPLRLRQGSGRRQHRPDSLIIYRQKRDTTVSGKENNTREGLVVRLLQSTPLLKRRTPSTQDPTEPGPQFVTISPDTQRRITGHSVCQAPLVDDTSSYNAILDEQISLPPPDAQQFFESCGLEGSLLNLLDNFYQLTGKTTPQGSLESVDRVSGRSGVMSLEEEKEEKTPVSVIERNARVIKWIYSCHRAKATVGHIEKQEPRESTV
ncbi:protein FAM110D isoform 1-T2 [Discoglossus pictus]